MIPPFRVSPNSVDPAAVPFMSTYCGNRIRAIGLGTFGSDDYGPMEIASAVLGAAKVGYRHFNCASVYANEKEDDAITAPAKRSGIHPAAICVKWAHQRGQIPIPFSVKRREDPWALNGEITPL